MFEELTDNILNISIEKETESNLKNGKKPLVSYNKYFYIESYGCAMNFSDSEIVATILADEGYLPTKDISLASLILLNTCSIRDKAEQTLFNRLTHLNGYKKKNPDLLIGILGCMAERLKEELFAKDGQVDLIVGPDSYRQIPNLLKTTQSHQKAINVLLSREETYEDIIPTKLDSNGITAFISIMRGCDNMCSFCVVPFTRGRERSRPPNSILNEATDLFNRGYREITLLGQNVDSYRYSTETNEIVDFAKLLQLVAEISPLLRIRFSTSHPKDITIDVLKAMAKYANICRYIHLPIQSGDNRILQIMNRQYTVEWYLEKIKSINEIVPNCGLSTDIICGFCSETEEEHQNTLKLMEEVKYDMSYMFFYSERPGTLASRKYKDDVPLVEKKRRLNEVIALQSKHSLFRYQQEIGKIYEVLIEGTSKKSAEFLMGRNTQNKVVIFPKIKKILKPGDYVMVKITNCSSGTLFGEFVN